MSEKVKFKDITINLDRKRKPLNGRDREKISIKKLYPYCGANNIMDYVDEYLFDEEILCIAEDGGKWGKNEICSYIMNEKCWVNNHVHVVKVKENVDIKYLKYWLNYTNLNSYITGAIVRKLTQKELNELEINLPSKVEQHEISNKIEKIQNIIETKKKQVEKLNELIKSQFVEMFGMPLENSKNWKVELADDVCLKITDGSHFSPKDVGKGYAMLSVKDMRNDGFHYENCKHVSKESFEILKNQKCVPEINDVLISKDGSYFYYGFVVKENKEEAVLSSIAILKPDIKTINPTFLCNYMLSESIVKYVSDHYVTGAALKRVILKGIKKIPVMVPPIELQNKFAEFVKQIDKQKFEIQKSLDEMQELYESLMDKYFG